MAIQTDGNLLQALALQNRTDICTWLVHMAELCTNP